MSCNICFYEGIFVEFERKKPHNIGVPTLTLPASSKKNL